MSRRVGLLGGTFDPIHQGHLDLGLQAQRALDLTSVVIIPSRTPPHRPAPLVSAFHRFAMAAMAAADLRGWRVSDVELSADGPAFSFTSTTLKRFHDRGYRADELFFVIGADAFAEIPSCKDYPAILDAAHFAVVSRPGHPVAELPTRLGALTSRMIVPAAPRPDSTPSIILIEAKTADVSSTDIRQRRASGEGIDGLVPAAVREHIERHGLYASASTDRRDDDGSRSPAAGRLHGQS